MLEQPTATRTIVSFLLDRTDWMAGAPGSNVIAFRPTRAYRRISTTSEERLLRRSECGARFPQNSHLL
jgi:hypothetical protein